jgi:RimJ/RimL family protein N-acetyltransferase
MEPLTLHPVGTVNRADALALEVGEAQLAYVSPVATMLETTQNHLGVHPYAVCVGDKAVGFFLLNFDPASTAHYRAAQGVGLEGFLIDLSEQGKGYGKATVAAIKELLAREHPDVREVNLTVNLSNAAAIRSYLGSGFEDTGRLYHGGRSGPQHIFSLPLY